MISLIKRKYDHICLSPCTKNTSVNKIWCITLCCACNILLSEHALVCICICSNLRVELKPFGIKVILVAPGGVISNIGKRSVSVIQDLDYKIYKPFQEKIYQRASYSQSINSTPTDVFARKTVDALLRKNPPLCFVYGYMSRTYAVLYYMPLWVRDWYFSRKFGLSKAISYEGITKKEI